LSKPIKLIIADDHVVVREGLTALIQDAPDMMVVGQANTGLEALDLIDRHKPHLALLDISMPYMTGLEAAAKIKSEHPQTPVVILTMHEETAFFFEALRAGAAGYIMKGAASDELLKAIRVVCRGDIYLPPHLTGLLVQNYLMTHQSAPPPDDPLTSREREVLKLIAQGMTNRKIAQQLTISINTVKSHRRQIYQKLDLDERADIVAYAINRGFLYA
jgi:two-component system response regulator NreC